MGEIERDGLEAAALAWGWALARSVGLPESAVAVRPVLNWGGFVNASFHVTAGSRRYHLKLSPREGSAGLETWWRVHERLTARYRAPQMLEWVTVPEIDCVGAVFEHLEGSPPRTLWSGLAHIITSSLAELHRDGVLASQLEARPSTCFDHYLESHDRRFREDLAGIARAVLPPFLTHGDVVWMEDEIEALRQMIRGSSAFQDPALAPVHGDLWLDNILVSPEGAWYLLDWDDLRLGDPVLDYATLLGPSASDVRPNDETRLPTGVAFGRAERERLSLYARATLLDWVIDPLSDWMDAERAPGNAALQVRAEKERVHRASKALYLERYHSG
jgi:Ser/Thr protein kinase RdoA (MazF antagonist)